MAKFLKSVLMLAVVVFACGCSEGGDSDAPAAKRTVLVYIAANNDLSGYAQMNMNDMVYGAADCNLESDNLIVYVSTPNENPCLYRIDKNGKKLIKSYPAQNSLQPDVMANVLAEVRERYPAPSNGVIFWSHGFGWLPKNIFATRADVADSDSPHPMTKNFGVDNLSTSGISAETIASILPDNAYDFIAFDACYMGAVEVVWPLRNKCKYFMASAAEVLTEGLPYSKVIADFFSDDKSYLQTVAYKYYKTYSEKSRAYDRSATIAVVDCQKLESMAAEMKRLANKYSDKTVDLNTMQWFDRTSYGNHFAYDMADFIDHLCAGEDASELDNFNNLLNKAIPAKYATETLWKGDYKNRDIVVKKFCGLSMFVPMTNEPEATMNIYKTTDWYKYFYKN